MKAISYIGLTGCLLFFTGCTDSADPEPPPSSSSQPSSTSSISSAISSSTSSAVSSVQPSSVSSSSIASSASIDSSSSSVLSSSSSQTSVSSNSSISEVSTSSSVASSSTSSTAIGDLYTDVIDPLIVQNDCILCHVNGGASGSTRLVFSAGENAVANNRSQFTQLASQIEAADQFILDKMRGGSGHGGGARFSSTTQEYADMAEFLGGLVGSSSSSSSADNLAFSKIVLDDPASTLRRATVLLAGRVATEAELQVVADDETALPQALKNIMTGEGFHNFLIRGANDRLLTDAFINGKFMDIMDPNSPRYPVLADQHVQAFSEGGAARDQFWQWTQKLTYGVSRAPLELIAYVVENDRPYTEILTADYTMVNPYSALIYNATLAFDDATDVTDFKPAVNQGQILMDRFYDGEFVQELGSVIYSHGDFVEYPHAGILNEPAFLNRYPSTDTNRNRARSRWTYYHFLDVDIEKSAPRTNDPEALADTNNPTMNNPNCTVCHIAMDPVAGAFQNYGDEGWYRSSWGGRDSLPDSYKWVEGSPYATGDTWYRDMRVPGFDGETVPQAEQNLQWLAQQIVSDDRFARATVKFWWSSLMSEPLRYAPENSEDATYQADLVGYEAQEDLINTLALGFRQGFNGGPAYNLKDLFVEMVMSTWFRGNSIAGDLSDAEQRTLQGVGKGRLLTPEELENKTRDLVGFAWGERFNATWMADGHWSMLQDDFRVYYGGIDAIGITERTEALNSLMSNVALGHALAVSCPAVLFDFNRSDSEKRLFKFVDRYTTPTSQDREQVEITGFDHASRSAHTIQLDLVAGPQQLRISFDNPHWDAASQTSLTMVVHSIQVLDNQGAQLAQLDGQDLLEYPGASVSTNQNGDPTGSVFWDGDLGSRTGWQLWNGHIEIPVSPNQAGPVTVNIVASKRNLVERTALMSASVNLEVGQASAGEAQIRQQLQFLHKTMLGEWLATDDPEIDASYQLLVELWQAREAKGFPRNAIAWDIESCEIPIDGWWETDHSAEFADPQFMQGTWMSMMVYFLTDYKYLHE